MTIDLGRVTPIYRGAYDDTATYELNDIVLSSGSLYWHIGETPTTGTAPGDMSVWGLAFSGADVEAAIQSLKEDAEAIALGTRAGTPVGPDDPYYHNNAAWYAAQASGSASAAALSEGAAAGSASAAALSEGAAAGSATAASGSAAAAAQWATGGTSGTPSATNNSKYYAEQAAAAVATMGTKAPAIVNSASGTIASFTDGADNMPIKSATVQITPVQSGSGDPSPTNVRPISGWTGAQIAVRNKNLIGMSQITSETMAYSNGEVANTVADNRTSLSLYVATYKGSTKVEELIVNASVTGVGTYMRILTTTNPDYDNIRIWHSGGQQDISFRVPFVGYVGNLVLYLRFTGTNPSVIGGFGFDQLQLEFGESFTSYEAYNPDSQTIPVSWSDSAGTIYKGTLTYNGDGTWTPTATHAMVDMGSLEWSSADANSASSTTSLNSVIVHPSSNNVVADFYCEMFKTTSRSALFDGDNTICVNTGGNIVIHSTSISGMTPEQVVAFVDGKYICYELATPIVGTPITTAELVTLLGNNNVWADCGDTSVEYRADTKLYIDSLTQPDDDMVADANIANGKYFVVNNRLYLSTAAIAQGAAIVPGTNCTETNIAEALNALNN